MKLKHLFLILLALCLIGFLTGCDSGGGGGSSSNDNGGGSNGNTLIFKVTDLVDHTGVSDFASNNGTIHYVKATKTHDDTVTLTVNDTEKTFSLYQKEVCSDPALCCDLTYYGTYEVSGNTVNVHCNKSKDTGTGTEDPQNWDDSFTFTNEDTVNIWGWVLTQQ